MLTDARVAAIKPPDSGQEEHRDTKVTGLRLRVGTSGKKTWIVRARAGQKIINKKLGSYPAMKLANARQEAEKLFTALARDGSIEALDRTFGAVATAWVEKVAKPKNSSWRLQERRLEMHVLPHWRARKIADIRRGDVRDLLDGVEGEVLPGRVLAIMKTVFRYALSRDWIDSSPVEGFAKPAADAQRDRVLSMEEVVAVWTAGGLLGFPFGPYFQTLALTAQRRTEVASMQWADVDLKAATWIIPAKATKSGRTHLVPLSASLVDMLGRLPRLGEYVFTHDGGTHVSGYAKAKARLDAFIGASDVMVSPWRLHDLRRTAATHMVRLGVSEEVVGRVLNHAPKGVTAKVYALHTYAPEKRSALDRWAAELMRAVEGKASAKVVALR
ncbi:MAG: tyrosine-type recombinase/integrase [Sphingomicrobium sp.]